jgi:hypothetical protein
MSLKINIDKGKVYLEYSPDNGTVWITELFEKNENFRAKGTFRLTKNELKVDEISEEKDITDSIFDTTKVFEIGLLNGDYYEIYKRVLSTDYDVLFHKSCRIKLKYFIVNSNVSILNRFERLAKQQIVIDGENESSISEQVFNDIIDSFPSRTEQKHYVDSRITNVLSQYLEGVKDSGNAFEKYLEKRNKIGNLSTITSIKSYEYEKYQFILNTLKEILDNSITYSESDWQAQILEIILLLYPKYIKCFSEVNIKDFYTNPSKTTNRFIDLMLVDSNGNVDVIEIKKPFENCVISKGKYRDNYTPMKALSGTIMQLEKYVFHLNKWGVSGERILSKKYDSELPTGMNIKITSPKGIAILGRDNNLSDRQMFDLEIIKRKYANLIDIITYDDLINRLENILEKYK